MRCGPSESRKRTRNGFSETSPDSDAGSRTPPADATFDADASHDVLVACGPSAIEAGSQGGSATEVAKRRHRHGGVIAVLGHQPSPKRSEGAQFAERGRSLRQG